jgi:hypothetical protein
VHPAVPDRDPAEAHDDVRFREAIEVTDVEHLACEIDVEYGHRHDGLGAAAALLLSSKMSAAWRSESGIVLQLDREGAVQVNY